MEDEERPWTQHMRSKRVGRLPLIGCSLRVGLAEAATKSGGWRFGELGAGEQSGTCALHSGLIG